MQQENLAANYLICRLVWIVAQNRLSVMQNSSIFISGTSIQFLLGVTLGKQAISRHAD